tara:strand:+ start:139 stop:735 length:597 start_codon:yes stop_codon:yes gene_type:complete
MIRFLYLGLFLLTFIPLQTLSYSNEIKIKRSEPVYLNQEKDTIQIQSIDLHEKEYSLVLESYAIHLRNDDISGQDIVVIGNYAYELEKGFLFNSMNSEIKSDQVDIYIPKRELKVLIDNNKNIYFTDGSIEVVFKNKVNFDAFAKSYGLVLERSFPSINAAIFSTSVNTIENTIKILKKDDLVSLANYDVINPNDLPD